MIFLFALLVVCIGAWALMYPSSSDPKNIKYVLWKADLYKVSLDQATTAMIGDPKRDKLVVGKTKMQLRDKFGSLLSTCGSYTLPQGLLSELILEGQGGAVHRAEFMDDSH